MQGRTASPLEVEIVASSLRRQLAPRNPAESLIVEHAVRAAADAARHLGSPDATIPSADLDGDERRSIAAFKDALAALGLLRKLARLAEGTSPRAAEPSARRETGNEWPVLPGGSFDAEPTRGRIVAVDRDGFGTDDAADRAFDDDHDGDDLDDAEPPIWAGRLVYDFDVSDESPVVKGTWITVRHVVSLIIDGATWAEILRSHPELTEEDLRVCVAYAVAEDDGMA